MAASGLEADLAAAADAHRNGRLDEAEIVLRRAVRRHADRYEPLALLAYVLQDLKLHSEAAGILERVLAMAPEAPGMASALALSLKALGREREAIPALERNVERLPGDAEALANLGGLYRETGRTQEALAVLRRAVACAPDWVPALNNLGNALIAAGQAQEAVAALERAHLLDPTRASIAGNLGVAYKNAGRLGLAIETQRRAIALDPRFADAHLNLGDGLLSAGDVAGAVAAFREAAHLAPDNPVALANVVFALDLDPTATLEDLAEARRLWNRRFARSLMPDERPPLVDPDPDRPLRIGYVSASFARGSVGSLVAPLIAGHDATNVVAVCYSDTARQDDVTERLRDATLWRETGGLSDSALADAVKADAIDILVDLSGHMAGSRLLAFARRPAPVQVTGWGNAAGTGLEAMDWFMADAALVPPGDEHHYQEKIWRLPHWLCLEPPATGVQRRFRAARSESAVTFASFNRLAKLSDDAIAAWCKALKALPAARMLLKYRGLEEPEIRGRLVEKFRQGGIGGDRLAFRGATGQRDHLDQLQDVDIVLDPFPHGGGVTTFEGLWMGTPTIALASQRPSGATTPLLLRAAGCPELIAEDPADYVAIAVALARDPKRLADYRSSIPERLARSTIMDVSRYVADVEAAYRGMWREALSRPTER